MYWIKEAFFMLLMGAVVAAVVIFFIVSNVHADEKLSPHFKRSEFNQRRDPLPPEQIKVDPRLIAKLEQLRALVNRPVVIASGYRSESYNKTIGGAKRSQHMNGKAADIIINGMSPADVAKLARRVGFSFIKVYAHHVHVDVR